MELHINSESGTTLFALLVNNSKAEGRMDFREQ